MNAPPLYVTFEDGLHVGVFVDRAAAERFNDGRRAAQKVEPVTVRYVQAPEIQPLGKIAAEVLDRAFQRPLLPNEDLPPGVPPIRTYTPPPLPTRSKSRRSPAE
jgi:hypothetical protein